MTILVFDSSAGKILNLHGLSRGAFLLRNAKRGTQRKIGGPRNTSRMTNYANVLAILSSNVNLFKKETVLSTNFLNLCPGAHRALFGEIVFHIVDASE